MKMVERMARAMSDADAHSNDFKALALAALKAMRNGPTMKMVGAAMDAFDKGQRGYTAEWQTLIDAAIKEAESD